MFFFLWEFWSFENIFEVVVFNLFTFWYWFSTCIKIFFGKVDLFAPLLGDIEAIILCSFDVDLEKNPPVCPFSKKVVEDNQTIFLGLKWVKRLKQLGTFFAVLFIFYTGGYKIRSNWNSLVLSLWIKEATFLLILLSIVMSWYWINLQWGSVVGVWMVDKDLFSLI